MELVEEERRLKEEADLRELVETVVIDDQQLFSHRDFNGKGRDVHPSAKQRKVVQTIAATLKFQPAVLKKRSSTNAIDINQQESLLDADEADLDITAKARLFVSSGFVNKHEPDKILRKIGRKHLFLFNDLLLITAKKDNLEQYDVQQVLWVKDLRIRYTLLDDEEKHSFELILIKTRSRPRSSILFTCENESVWRQWIDDLENTLLAYHKQTELAKQLGWFHEIIQGSFYSASFSGDIILVRKHVKALGELPLRIAAMGQQQGVGGGGNENGYTTLDTADNSGMTALHWSSLRGHEVIVRLLLDRGAEVDVLQRGENTPLLLAAAGGHESVARLLIERGAELTARNHRGHDAVFMAVVYGHAAKGLPWLLQLLTHRGADLNEVDTCGATALHLCAEKNLARPVRMLVDSGANVNAKHGTLLLSPLQLACNHRSPEVETIRSFLDKGAYPNWRDHFGRTAFEVLVASAPNATNTNNARPGMITKAASINTSGSIDEFGSQQMSTDSITVSSPDRWRAMEDTLNQVGDWAVRALPALLELVRKGARFDVKDIDYLRPSFKSAVLEARDLWTSKCTPSNFREFIQAREQAGEEMLLARQDWHNDKKNSASCPLCGDAFGLTNRRHHCRACGVLCCDKCSSKRLPLSISSSSSLMSASSENGSGKDSKDGGGAGGGGGGERCCDGCFNRLLHEASQPSPDHFRVRQLKQCALDAIQCIEELIEALDDPTGDPNNFQSSLRETRQLTKELDSMRVNGNAGRVSFSSGARGSSFMSAPSTPVGGSNSSMLKKATSMSLTSNNSNNTVVSPSIPRPAGEALIDALKIRDARLYRAEDVVAKFLESADGYHRISKKLMEQKQASSRLWGAGASGAGGANGNGST